MMPRLPVNRPVLVAPPLLHLHAAGPRTPQVTEPVSVLLPLRHEPSVALAAVRAAVAQRNVKRLDVVVLDVGCTEETYRVLNDEYGDDARVRLLDTACLPTGWSRASHRGQQLAVGARGRILFFADPAAPLGPYAVAAGASLLRRQSLDLLVLDAGGRRAGRFAVAADTEAYWRIGGHRAAAHDPHPLALLRAMRRARASTGLADGRRVIPADTRAHAEDLPPEPRDQYFHAHRGDNGDTADSTFGSLSTTARRILAALRATGADLAGFSAHAPQDDGQQDSRHGGPGDGRSGGLGGAHVGGGLRAWDERADRSRDQERHRDQDQDQDRERERDRDRDRDRDPEREREREQFAAMYGEGEGAAFGENTMYGVGDDVAAVENTMCGEFARELD